MGGDGAVLGGSRGATGELALGFAVSEADADRGGGGAGVGGTDEGGEVEVQAAEIGTGDDSVGSAVERIASGDGGVDDGVELAGGWVVIKGLLNDVGVEVLDLLLAVTESWGAGDDTIVEVAVFLDLGPSFASSL